MLARGGESGLQTRYLTELIGRVRMGSECGWERPFRGAKRTSQENVVTGAARGAGARQ